MEQFLYPTLTAFFASGITWFFSRKSSAIDVEIKSAEFYRSLLDDAIRRLNEAIATINAQDLKIKALIDERESLASELRKHKRLNGKTE